MKDSRKWLALLLSLVLVLGLAACGGTDEGEGDEGAGNDDAAAEYTLVEEGKLIVGSDLDYPPMEMLNGETPEGFDVDLMNAIGEELGLEVEFRKEIFDTLLASLDAGKFDVIASSLTINDERKQLVNFTDPYFDSNQSIAMKTGSKYDSPADMNGKKIGVQSGTTGEQWANENLKPAGATVVPFSETTEAFSALQAGNVDAVVNDLPVTANLVSDASKGLAIVEQIPTGEQYGFAVAKDNEQLLEDMNDALAKIRESGKYDEIYEKWIPAES